MDPHADPINLLISKAHPRSGGDDVDLGTGQDFAGERKQKEKDLILAPALNPNLNPNP